MKQKNPKCPSCQEEVSALDAVCNQCKRYLNPESIKADDKVLYAPNYASMQRGITDNAYNDLGFYPGDIFTVKEFEIDETGFKFILVIENDVRFSPFDLMPAKDVSEDTKKNLLKKYNELLKRG